MAHFISWATTTPALTLQAAMTLKEDAMADQPKILTNKTFHVEHRQC